MGAIFICSIRRGAIGESDLVSGSVVCVVRGESAYNREYNPTCKLLG